MKTFEVQSRQREKRKFQTYFVEGKNVSQVIDLVLSRKETSKLSVATWFNSKQTYAEILMMNDEFKEEEFIRITLSEKD